jgi:hypothetical protein
MFSQKINTDNNKFSLNITITCSGKKKFRVWAEDCGKKNSKYADREIEVSGTRTIHFNFPIVPKTLFIGCLNCENPKDNSFKVETEVVKLKTYNIWIDEETDKFLKLALHFSQVCGFESAKPNGRLFKTDDNEFNIKYFDVIKDVMSRRPMNTPARIGHKSGIIEVSKNSFDKYTVAMRMIILLHEFSHKYKNPKIGLEISNETGADINALYIYLGLGFSKIDAICVFAKVFLRAQTESNINRLRRITDYIEKFENLEYATAA